MPTSPLTKEIDLPTFKISVEGQPIKDFYEVISIDIEREINKIASAKIILADGEPSEENFEISESDDFVPGKNIEIALGYHAKEATAFKGVIIAQNIKVRTGTQGVRSMLTVKCNDEAVKLTMGRKCLTFKDKKDSDIISSIIGTYGLSKTIDATTIQHKKVVQFDATDWDFILSRAEINGMLAFCNDGKLEIQTPVFSGSPGIGLTYGVDVLDFQADLDAKSQLAAVECISWDGTQQKVLKGNSTEPSMNSQSDLTGKKLSSVIGLDTFSMQTVAPEEEAVLKEWAKAKIQKSRMAKVRGKVSMPGSTLPALGKLIELKGFGKRFNGNAFISSVHHSLEEGTWITTVGFGLNDQWFVEREKVNSMKASGLLPGINGLQIGTVKKIDSDPDGEFRVLVNIPMIEEAGDGVWARLTNYYASNGIGNYFYPEIGDEVALGFLNDDPRFPIIIGALYGKKLKPPYTPDSENKVKGIVTKSEMKLTFEEDNKNIIIETPGGNKVTISDQNKNIILEDQNSNKVEMSENGISFDSPKDISITTKGNFSVDATSNVTIMATGNASVSGNNVDLKANIGLTAQGSATAALKASGQVEVKGAMVMIN